MNEPPEKLRWRERIYNLFPTLERGERKQLVERIAVGADGGVDFVVMMLLATPLLINVLEKSRSGQMRPANYPVSVEVRRAARHYLEDHPSLRLIEMARQSIAPESGITVVLTTTGELQAGIRDELIEVIRKARRNSSAIVRVFILLEAPVVSLPVTP